MGEDLAPFQNRNIEASVMTKKEERELKKQQKLDSQLYFSLYSPNPVTLYITLTTLLATFNSYKHKPLAFGGHIMETPTAADSSATIIS